MWSAATSNSLVPMVTARMLGMGICMSDRNDGEISEWSHRTSITFQCSARKCKWAPQWPSFILLSKCGKLRTPAVTASFRVKLPKAVLKLSLAVTYSISKSSSSTVRKTVKVFGLLETRKVGLRLSWYFRTLRDKISRTTDSNADGTMSRKDVLHRKSVQPEHAGRQKNQEKVSFRNWCKPSHFASKKNKRALIFQVVMLLTFMLLGQLGIACPVVCTMTASLVIGSVVSRFGVEKRLDAKLRKLGEEAVSFGLTVSPKVMLSIVETLSRGPSLRLICGTATLFLIILFQLLHPSQGPQLYSFDGNFDIRCHGPVG